MYVLLFGKRRQGMFEHFGDAMLACDAQHADAVEELGVGVVYERTVTAFRPLIEDDDAQDSQDFN